MEDQFSFFNVDSKNTDIKSDKNQSAIQEMEKLIALIEKYSYAYYTLDDPIVSDEEFDILYSKLQALEFETQIVLPNSPTKKVGGEIKTDFKTYKHLSRLYSLNKVKTTEEIEAFILKIQKETGIKPELTLEHKFDGLTLSLTYEKGELITAATRGDGVVGEIVTEQCKKIKTVPKSIDFKGKIEIQGECIMSFSSFDKYNETAEKPLKNPRNAAAGAIRNLDSTETEKRDLDFIAYNVGYYDSITFDTQMSVREFLQQQGFKTGEEFNVFNDVKDIKMRLEYIEKHRSELDFLIDGAVLKVNDIGIREVLGYTEKFPKWAMAFKFKAIEKTTILKDVLWEVSRTLRINPIAVLEPINLMGATISRATLNNYDDIVKKGLKLGSRVLIRRSNDVIPEIMGVYDYSSDSSEIKLPTKCPACGAPVRRDSVFLYCTNNVNCASQIISSIDHFCSKGAMNIEGLSEKTAEMIYNELNINSLDKIYTLTLESLLTLDGFKDKKAENIMKSIENSKKTSLSNFLYAIGIPTIGKKTARDLAERFGTLEGVMQASVGDIVQIEDFGEIMAKNVVDFFANENNKNMLKSLLAHGITFINEASKSGVFVGKTIVLTGSLETMPRSKAQDIIINNGGSIADSVSKRVNLVVVGKEPGSKLVKAKQLGIEIIDETAFCELIK